MESWKSTCQDFLLLFEEVKEMDQSLSLNCGCKCWFIATHLSYPLVKLLHWPRNASVSVCNYNLVPARGQARQL